jgi:hypothetical protein
MRDLNEICDPASTVITIAQAISFAVDEVQEFGTADGEMGLFLSREADRSPERDLRVTGVSAELENTATTSSFTVTTSDGRTFQVKVSEV